MKRIALSGGKAYALVDDEDYRTLSAHSWQILPAKHTSYAKTHISGKTIYMHRLIMGLVNAPRHVFVDHIDTNGLDNRKANLLISNNQNNQRNQRKHTKGYSKYKGVSTSGNKANPWTAQFKLSGIQIHIGHYRTEEEAAIAYNNAALKHFGEHAHLNVIGP